MRGGPRLLDERHAPLLSIGESNDDAHPVGQPTHHPVGVLRLHARERRVLGQRHRQGGPFALDGGDEGKLVNLLFEAANGAGLVDGHDAALSADERGQPINLLAGVDPPDGPGAARVGVEGGYDGGLGLRTESSDGAHLAGAGRFVQLVDAGHPEGLVKPCRPQSADAGDLAELDERGRRGGAQPFEHRRLPVPPEIGDHGRDGRTDPVHLGERPPT